MRRRVSYHDVLWDRRSRSGALRLSFDDRTRVELAALSLNELTLMCTLLREEKPVFYDDETETLSTDPDYVAHADPPPEPGAG